MSEFDLVSVKEALVGRGRPRSGSGGAELLAASQPARDEAKELAMFFTGLISKKDAASLLMLARMGCMDTDEQVRVRNEMAESVRVAENLKRAEALVTRVCGQSTKARGFFGGPQADEEDAVLFSSIYSFWALATLPEQRIEYPHLSAWFLRCALLIGNSIQGATHLLGQKRAGNQIDCYADSRRVRACADRSNAINLGHRKKKTQRQLEKEAKLNAMLYVDAAATFAFGTNPIGTSLSIDDKINAVRAALRIIGAEETDPTIVKHAAAKTMADMPRDLYAKGIVCKNLFLKAKKPLDEHDSGVWLVSVPDEAVVDLKVLSKTLGYKEELRQAPAELLAETLGLLPGSVSPLGLINDHKIVVNVILDEVMLKAGKPLWFHPLTNEASMAISAQTLVQVVSHSKRKPKIISFERPAEHAAHEGGEAPPKPAPQAALSLSNEEARNRVFQRLAEAGFRHYREANPDLAARKPVGHSTHNLFVKDKKSGGLFLITAAQQNKIDLKAIAKAVGAKELRMASGSKESFCQETGCITPLSLFNNVQGDVQWVVDSAVLKMSSLRICAGCDDPLNHAQHNVVDAPVTLLLEMLSESNHSAPIEVEMEVATE